MSYDTRNTAILLVDPYNDFLSEGGKLWPRVKAVAEDVKLVDHLGVVISSARDRGYPVVFVPHHRWEPGDYVSFQNPTPYQLASAKAKSSPRAHGVAASTTSFNRNRVSRLRMSIGARAASPTQTSISN